MKTGLMGKEKKETWVKGDAGKVTSDTEEELWEEATKRQKDLSDEV